MGGELIKLLEAVHDEKSFLRFVDALVSDRLDEIEKEKVKPSSPYGPGANGWENVTVDRFLEAASSWAESSNFGRDLSGNLFKDNCWHQFATFLYCGKIYE